MNTYAIQVELHFQSSNNDDQRFDYFVEELKVLATKHGISFGDYQTMQLPEAEYTIDACASCGQLTVDHTNIQAGDENMLPDFWFNIRRGSVVAGVLNCEFCRIANGAT